MMISKNLFWRAFQCMTSELQHAAIFDDLHHRRHQKVAIDYSKFVDRPYMIRDMAPNPIDGMLGLAFKLVTFIIVPINRKSRVWYF